MKMVFGLCLALLLVFSTVLAWAEVEDEETIILEFYEIPWSEIEQLYMPEDEEKGDQGKIMISGDYTLSYKIVFPFEEMNQEHYSYWTDRLNLDLTYQVNDHLTVGISLKTTDILVDP